MPMGVEVGAKPQENGPVLHLFLHHFLHIRATLVHLRETHPLELNDEVPQFVLPHIGVNYQRHISIPPLQRWFRINNVKQIDEQ